MQNSTSRSPIRRPHALAARHAPVIRKTPITLFSGTDYFSKSVQPPARQSWQTLGSNGAPGTQRFRSQVVTDICSRDDSAAATQEGAVNISNMPTSPWDWDRSRDLRTDATASVALSTLDQTPPTEYTQTSAEESRLEASLFPLEWDPTPATYGELQVPAESRDGFVRTKDTILGASHRHAENCNTDVWDSSLCVDSVAFRDGLTIDCEPNCPWWGH